MSHRDPRENLNETLYLISRIADNQKRVSHLTELQNLGDLKIFRADLTDEGSFEVPVAGCQFVFHVATPVNFASQDPEVRLPSDF